MSRTLDPQLRRALTERIRYYNELGIYDFYRREPNAELPREPETSVVEDPALLLRTIREDLGDCTRCPLHQQGRKQIVFGVGNPHAELMFIGEAPGADEDQQGEPFVGRAGQLLTRILKAMNFTREDVYIANILKCRPDVPAGSFGNRPPTPTEMQTCRPYLVEQIDIIKPKVIVALGAVAV